MPNTSRSNSNGTWRYDLAASTFCICVLVLGLIIGHFHRVGNFGVETDFYGTYAIQAENILSGQPYTYQHNPPGYCLILAALSLVEGDTFTSGKIISAFAAALLGWITYLLFKSLFAPHVALASSILLLIALIPSSFIAATDIPAALAIMLPLWILFRRPVITSRTCFLSGIFSGVAYLIRYNTAFVIAGISFSLIFIVLEDETYWRRISKLVVFLVGVLIVSSPWLIINWRTNGSPFANTAYLQVAAHFFHPGGDRYAEYVRSMSTEFDSLSEVLLYNPRWLMFKFTRNIVQRVELLANRAVGYPGFLFAGAGFVLLLGDLTRRRLCFFVVSLLGYLLLCAVGFYLRYYLFLFPSLFLLVTYFFFEKNVVKTLQESPILKSRVSWLMISALAFFLGARANRSVSDILAHEPRYLMEVAEFLKNDSSPGDVIIARKPHIAYLAGLKRSFPDFPPAKTLEEFKEKALKSGARYVFYSDIDASYWPELKFFEVPNLVSSPFKLIYQNEQSNTLIYKVERPTAPF